MTGHTPWPKLTNFARYGLTFKQANRLVAELPYCPLCSKPFHRYRPPCLDHDHRTGAVRGLLCASCNRSLLEDVGWLRNATDYLTNPPAASILGEAIYVPHSPGAAGFTEDYDA